jgi:peptide/nickel transport system substrate-binding protein
MRISGIITICILVFSLLACQSCQTGQKGENTLRIRTEAEATVLNPYMPSPGYSRFVANIIFQTLGAPDPKTLEMRPTLITQMPELRTITEGPRAGMFAYDFEVRPEANWDDNKPITAHDIAFILKIILNPYLPTQAWRGYFETLKHLEIDTQNPKKFTAYFDKYYILTLESMCQVPILPAHLYDAQNTMQALPLAGFIDGTAAKTADTVALKAFAAAYQAPGFSNDPKMINGSGAYKLESIQPGESITLTRKANFWGSKVTSEPLLAAHPDKIIYRTIKDEAATENLMRNQEIDLGSITNVQKFLEMQKDPELSKNYEIASQPTFNYGYWMLNTRNPILQDKAVRKALAQLVDYQKIQTEVYQQMAERTIGPINPTKAYYNKDVQPYQFDITTASTALQAAGWQDTDNDGVREKQIAGKKQKLTFKIITSGASAVSTKTAEMIRDAARKAGVEIMLESADINVITQKTRAGDFESAILAAAAFPGLEDLYQLYHSSSLAPKGDNRSFYASPTADALIEQIRANPDAKTRGEQYKQLQAVISDDAPHVFLFVPRQRYFAHKRFTPVMSAMRPGYYEGLFQLK